MARFPIPRARPVSRFDSLVAMSLLAMSGAAHAQPHPSGQSGQVSGAHPPLEAPTLAMEGEDPGAGYLTLSWSGAPPAALYQLEEASSPAFADATVRYEGRQTATVRSGLRDGPHLFRVRARRDGAAPWGAWSEPLLFPVAHHSLRLALSLFALGAFVFGGTLLFLVGASRGSASG